MTAVEVEPSRSVLLRALSILDAFEAGDIELSLTVIAERAALPKPTAFRMAQELVDWGALERGAHGGYELGVRLFVLGERVPRHRDLREAAMPYLEDLYEATHENVNLGVLNGSEVLCLARVSGHRSSDIAFRVGNFLPAHSTSIGKALLAYSDGEVVRAVVAGGLTRFTPNTIVMPGPLTRTLRQVVERGYATTHEETRPGVVSVAAPVFGPHGVPLAAISITGRASRVDVHRLAPAVCSAAASLSRSLASARSLAR
jgi:DNA-binding IclR family transcriptional regulator